jgi:endo-1,4-beta-xylanase
VGNHSLTVTNALYIRSCLEQSKLAMTLVKVSGRLLFLSLFLIAASSPAPPLLREGADRAKLLIGSAVRSYALSDAAYSQTLGRQFNMVEAEDSMKWWVLRRNERAFDFDEGDVIVRFAHAHRMKVRGHCLVWDHDNPEWLTQAHFTPERLSRTLRAHITVMKHYSGQVFAWDVVNEAFDHEGKLKDSPWYNQPGIGLAHQGTAYIERAFRWAHVADPLALLFYNEGGVEAMNAKSDSVYAMVKDFKSRGVPIDGVGLQMHISRFDFDANGVAANIARLTALRLQVHITELDVALPLEPGGAPRPQDLQHHADIYRLVVHTCLQNPGCTAVQTWGFTDKYSWIASHTHGSEGAALLFDKNYQPKPAYSSLLAEIFSWPEHAR